MKEGIDNLPALLLKLIPKEMCRQLFRLFPINQTKELSSTHKLMLWRTLIHVYFPYLTDSNETMDPQTLMDTFIQERGIYENYRFRRWGVTEKIDTHLILSALSGDLNLIAKSDVAEKSKNALYILAFANGHYRAFFKLDAKGIRYALKLILEMQGARELLAVVDNFSHLICPMDKEKYLLNLAIDQDNRALLRLIDKHYCISKDYLASLFVNSVANGYFELPKYILEKCQISLTEMKNAFAGAIVNRNFPIAEYLLELIPEVDVEKQLRSAAGNGELDFIRNFFEFCPDFDHSMGGKLIYLAAHRGHVNIVKFLETKSDLFAGNSLWSACLLGNFSTVKFLLTHCSTISISDKIKAKAVNHSPKSRQGNAYYYAINNILNASIANDKAQEAIGLAQDKQQKTNETLKFLHYYENCWQSAALNTDDQPDIDELSNTFGGSCTLS